MKSWKANWDVICPFFKFSQEMRKIMYTTYAEKITMPIFCEIPVNKRIQEKISA